MTGKVKEHNCMKHLNSRCKCMICGKVHHSIVSDDNGSGTGMVTARCTRCHAYERFYGDTGTTIESTFEENEAVNPIPAGHWDSFLEESDAKPEIMQKKNNFYSEPLYVIQTKDDEHYITGITNRETAEQFGICHLTVCICTVVSDGPQRGKWIVQDRTAKQWAKGDTLCKSPSWNFFGGHCTAHAERNDLIGQKIPLDICLEAANRELAEELLYRSDPENPGKWEDERKTSPISKGDSYCHGALIPIGYATYTDDSNVEVSALYVLPVPGKDVIRLIAADNYIKDGAEYNIWLPVATLTENELRKMAENPEMEICDAITRLWLPENKLTYDKLRETIRQYQ